MKKSYDFQGQKIMGEEVEFEIERENWNTYILHDGTKIRMKSVVSKVVRLDLYKPNREPVYIVESSNVMGADVPEVLLKRKEE